MPSPLSSVRSAALLAGALAVVVYANSLVNRFAYDDARIILDNTELHSLETLPGAVFQPYWHGNEGELELGLWRPTTTLLLGLEYALAGENPTLYHAVNVVGHGLVSQLVRQRLVKGPRDKSAESPRRSHRRLHSPSGLAQLRH